MANHPAQMPGRWYLDGMEQQLIKIPKPITPSRFAIPLDPLEEGLNEREAMKDWATYTRVMEARGFKPLASAKSFSYRDAEKSYRDPRMEDYAIWYHPKGVIAKLHSYSTQAYVGYKGDQVPARHALGSVTYHAIVDLGHGREIQHRGAVEIRGTGGTTPLFDGRTVREISETVHTNTQETLGSFLRMTQNHGRLLAIGQWHACSERLHLNIPKEILIPLTEPAQTETLPSQEDLDAAFDALMDTFPAEIATAFREERRRDEEFSKRDHSQRTGLVWDPVEFVINEFTEAMSLAGKRWSTREENELLDHWARVALGEFGDELDPERMRAYEKGPAGLSLPVALLYAKRTAKSAPGLLEQLLETAPEDVLRRWATQVDASGYTLGLRAVARSFTERGIESHDPPEVDVLGILHRRLGNAGLVMATPTRSLLGIPLEDGEQEGRYRNSLQKRHQELAAAIQRLDAWGVEWAQHLRWRNYPNLYKDKEPPQFTQINGVVDPAAWKTRMGDNWTTALDATCSLLEAAQIEQNTVAATPSRPSSLRRM